MLPRELCMRLVARLSYQQVRCASSTAATRMPPNVIDELAARGMLADLTSRSVRTHLDKSTTVYLGVDPSARSLHVGNLIALIGLLHFRLKGHNAIALIGGATGSVGDPSGRSTERNALAPEELEQNVAGITAQLKSFLSRATAFAANRQKGRYETTFDEQIQMHGSLNVLNNIDWTGNLSLLKFLARVGKYARMGVMLSRESVKSRLDSPSGLSFTEFTYQLLQAYDYLTLHERHGCTVQLGGSDQMGNIQAGIDLIRRMHALSNPSQASPSSSASTAAASVSSSGDDKKKKVPIDLELSKEDERAYGVTFQLLTTSSGEKFGKSAGNAIWLDPQLTSPFELYQFFLRTTDDEVHRYLKIFTFLRVEEIEGIVADHQNQPELRLAQRILAMEAVELVHGAHGLKQALAATQLFYGSSAAASSGTTLKSKELIDALDGIPDLSSPSHAGLVGDVGLPSVLLRLPRDQVVGQLVERLVLNSGLLPSKTQIRRAIDGGQISINGIKMGSSDHNTIIEDKHIDENGVIVIKQGKKNNRAILVV